MRRFLLLALATAASFLAAPAATRAQTISRDVRLIVPFAPGGTVDLLGRILADGLAPALGGRNIVVENRSGAGTFIAMQAVAQAPADGHTLSLASGAVLATAPVLPGMAMPIDPDKALAPVTNLIRVPIVLVGRPQGPFRDLPGLIAFAKAHPGRLNIGQSGAGSLTHLLAARLGHEAGISMVQIQYRGGTPALLDVMAGTADLYFSLLPKSLPHIRDAKLRPIAFASPERNPNLPEVSLVKGRAAGLRRRHRLRARRCRRHAAGVDRLLERRGERLHEPPRGAGKDAGAALGAGQRLARSLSRRDRPRPRNLGRRDQGGRHPFRKLEPRPAPPPRLGTALPRPSARGRRGSAPARGSHARRGLPARPRPG